MPASATGKPRGTVYSLGKHHGRTACTFLLQRLAQWQIPLRIGRCPIGQHALLRKRGNALRELLCNRKRFTGFNQPIGKPHGERLVSGHRAAGQDHVQRAAHADNAG